VEGSFAFDIDKIRDEKGLSRIMRTDYDVIVAGGGTAGVIAAIAAAREGADTLVIERYGHLGGTAVTGLPFLGMYDGKDKRVNAGIAKELVDRMVAEKGSLDGCFGSTWMDKNYRFSITPYEQETYKYVAQEMLLEAGAKILFHSFVSDVVVEDGRLKALEAVGKSGKQLYNAGVFIDTTGDGDIAAKCKVPMVNKDLAQNASILFRIGGVNTKLFLEALQKGEGIEGWENWHTRVLVGPRLDDAAAGPIHLAGHIRAEDGKEITFTAISIISTEVYMNATRTVGINATSTEDITRGEISERRNVWNLMKTLTQNVPGFKNSYLLYTAPVGFRESRNIIGEYLLQKEDVLSGRQFDDSVVRGAYPIDIHDPLGGRTQFMFIKDGGSYSIPYRCFLPKDIDCLLVAGRCLSATHEAMGSARIMGVAMGQGQAVGTAAALSSKAGVSPRSIDISQLQNILRRNGAIL
jgi:hypothetical protein